MRYSTLSFVSAIAATASAANTIEVTVGKGGLVYTPSEIKASAGDSVVFSFFPKNHTVTQSSFAKPCHPLENGFFSSFVPTASSPSGSTFTIVVNDTKPIWLYCGQTTGNHCQSGMVAAINAPTTGNTFAQFAALAKNATTSTNPPVNAPVGGVLSLAAAGSSSSSSAASGGDKTITTTVTTFVTGGGYGGYSTTYATTITTAADGAGVSTATTAGGAATTGTSSSTSALASQTKAGGAGEVRVGSGVLGAAAVVAWALL